MDDSMERAGWIPRFSDRMAGMHASEIRELLKVIAQPGVISFAGAVPACGGPRGL